MPILDPEADVEVLRSHVNTSSLTVATIRTPYVGGVARAAFGPNKKADKFRGTSAKVCNPLQSVTVNRCRDPNKLR